MSKITSLASLINGSMPAADIVIERDPLEGMARVTVNGRLVWEDREGRFNPTHSSGWHLGLAERYGTWISPETLADVLYKALSTLPDGCVIRGSLYMSGRK
jgi:hypothetical protein